MTERRTPVRLLHRDLMGIASSMTISRFGYSLIAVFVPFLLLQKGLVLWQICAFYMAYALSKLCLNYPATVLSVRKGVRFGLTVGYGATAVYFLLLMLFLSGRAEWTVYVLPFILALDHAFTWGAQHLHISHAMDTARTGRDIAFIHSLAKIAGIAAPITGGLIALHFGRPWLAAVAALCVMLALIPIRKAGPLKEAREHDRVAYNLQGAPRSDLFANFVIYTRLSVICSGRLIWPSRCQA